VRLSTTPQALPNAFEYLNGQQLVPLNAGENIAWTLQEVEA
jgi:hypothetical protein